MPASFNRVMLIGNLTRDPELRLIPSGQPVTTFTLAVNRTYAAQSGEKKEEVTFIRIVVWGKLANVCNEYLRKGSPVFVEGRIQSRSWDGPDGTKRSTVEVVAQSVQFLNKGTGRGAASEGATAEAPANEGVIEDTFEHSGKSSAEPDEEVPF